MECHWVTAMSCHVNVKIVKRTSISPLNFVYETIQKRGVNVIKLFSGINSFLKPGFPPNLIFKIRFKILRYTVKYKMNQRVFSIRKKNRVDGKIQLKVIL